MAAKNKTAAVASTATGEAASTASKSRGGRPPGPVFMWDSQRDQVLVVLMLNNKGTLSAEQVYQQLITHPAFAADANLLTKEKVRQRVGKLSARTEKKYGVTLDLRRTSNSGYDVDGTLDAVMKAMGIQAQPQQAQAASTQEPAAAPAASAPTVTPVPLPTLSPGFAGGLIATPGGGGA